METVKKAEKEDIAKVAGLAALLWKNSSADELSKEFYDILEKGGVFFLKYEGGVPIGFAQCSLRHDYVEGTETSPVGYLEGIFVCDGYRRRGYAKELLAACEAWAKKQGCTEFASDCEINNLPSISLHKKYGFNESAKLIHFIKNIGG